MQIELNANSYGTLVWAHRLLTQKSFLLKVSKGDNQEPDLSDWEGEALKWILNGQSKFGKIGILFDHKAEIISKKVETLRKQKIPCTAKDLKRGKKIGEIIPIPVQILFHLAEEGWGSSVEFRRIARIFLREAKNKGVDSVFFPEMIFGEAQTHKTLQSIAGKSLKIFTAYNIPILPFERAFLDKTEKGSLILEGSLNEFEKTRIEKILQRKLPKIGKKNNIPSV